MNRLSGLAVGGLAVVLAAGASPALGGPTIERADGASSHSKVVEGCAEVTESATEYGRICFTAEDHEADGVWDLLYVETYEEGCDGECEYASRGFRSADFSFTFDDHPTGGSLELITRDDVCAVDVDLVIGARQTAEPNRDRELAPWARSDENRTEVRTHIRTEEEAHRWAVVGGEPLVLCETTHVGDATGELLRRNQTHTEESVFVTP